MQVPFVPFAQSTMGSHKYNYFKIFYDHSFKVQPEQEYPSEHF